MDQLFDEILLCPDCPNDEVILAETDNGKAILAHLKAAHPGVDGDAFVTANRQDVREHIQEIYVRARDYIDSDFSTNFLRQFEARLWELATYQYLIDCGVTVYKNTGTEGPDFDTSIGYVECKVVKRGNGGNAVPLMKAATYNKVTGELDEIDAKPVPMNEIKLRFSSAFAEKQRKYEGYTQKAWFDHSKPRLIAINWYCGGTAIVTNILSVSANGALQVLFATGYSQLVIDKQNPDVESIELSRVPELTNSNGESFPVGYFADYPESEAKRIDGIIHTNSWPGIYRPDTFMAVNNAFTTYFDSDQLIAGCRAVCTLGKTGFQVALKPYTEY